jgi:hypothetical protein
VQSTIVGVVRDVLDQRLDEPAGPRIFVPLDPFEEFDRFTYIIGSGTGRRRAVAADQIRLVVAAASPNAIVERIDRIGTRLADTVRERTFAALMLGLFGVAGIVVTVAGLVGLVTFVVGRRTREIAIRIAIGAGTGDIRRLVTGEAVAAAFTGGAAGLLGGQWLSTWLEHLVFGIEAGNWITTSAAGGVIIAIMTLAALTTARQAVRLQPTIALRVE